MASKAIPPTTAPIMMPTELGQQRYKVVYSGSRKISEEDRLSSGRQA